MGTIIQKQGWRLIFGTWCYTICNYNCHIDVKSHVCVFVMVSHFSRVSFYTYEKWCTYAKKESMKCMWSILQIRILSFPIRNGAKQRGTTLAKRCKSNEVHTATDWRAAPSTSKFMAFKEKLYYNLQWYRRAEKTEAKQ